ncbi:precorrin-2 C(20)-methyltransferase [Rhabdochromatium marinum]|uniref:precorrin-2 C(20)-methyltransferase n=1 Tax=Rhabdochromatium marinum TaxID=48729 RepID=UPI001F5B5438|nr:precorrin-2 C(20)-methyltransferase [Rhabdochromatium marinum]MBK1649890.1 precorrin-2 C(20)-methyltransferase [Rhabdochromatium marinum]
MPSDAAPTSPTPERTRFGRLIGASLGPGDPGLITRAAWQALTMGACWAWPLSGASATYQPSHALGIAQRAGLEPPANSLALHFPMTRDPATLAAAWAQAATEVVKRLRGGRDLVFLVEGDGSTHSTFGHLARAVRALEPRIPIETIAGVPSFTAAAAASGIALAEGEESIAICAAPRALRDLDAWLARAETLVLLKVRPVLDALIEALATRKLLASAVFVDRVGTPNERIVTDLTRLRGERVAYLSLVLIRPVIPSQPREERPWISQAETLIATLTEPGARLAASLGQRLSAEDGAPVRLLLPERLRPVATAALAPPVTGKAKRIELTTHGDGLAAALPAWFTGAAPEDHPRQLIFIGAAGLIIRLLAPHLRDKRCDPAVVVIDEASRFVIPLLGGHLGGANALARQLAERLHAQLVLTTASDVQGTIAVDLLGRELGWQIEASAAALRRAASCVVDGRPVLLIEEACGREWWTGVDAARGAPPANIHCLPSFEAAAAQGLDTACAVLWVTHRRIDADLQRRLGERLVLYRPPRDTDAPPVAEQAMAVTLGVGCDRGAALETVAHCVDAALAQLDAPQVQMLASVTQKQDEPAIQALAAARGWPLHFYPPAELAKIPVANPSETVRRVLGTPAVAEAAALRAAGAELKDLLIEKQTHRGADGKHATVAVARARNAASGSP